MKTKLLQYTPSLTPSQAKEDLMVPEVSTFTKIILEEMYLGSYAILVMKHDTMQGIVLTNRR